MTVALALGGRVTRARTSTSTSSLRGARACACACDLVFGRQPALPLRRRFLVSPGPSSGKRLETVCVNPPLNATQHCPHHLSPSSSTSCRSPEPSLRSLSPLSSQPSLHKGHKAQSGSLASSNDSIHSLCCGSRAR